MTHAHVGKTCPYCQSPLKPKVIVQVCPACQIPHHRDCWQENGGCTTFGCRGQVAAGTPAAPRRPDGRHWADLYTAPPPRPSTPASRIAQRCDDLVFRCGFAWPVLGWILYIAWCATSFYLLDRPFAEQWVPFVVFFLFLGWGIIDAIEQRITRRVTITMIILILLGSIPCFGILSKLLVFPVYWSSLGDEKETDF